MLSYGVLFSHKIHLSGRNYDANITSRNNVAEIKWKTSPRDSSGLLPKDSFFIFGPRGTGKSTWLKKTFPNAYFIDLLDDLRSGPMLRIQTGSNRLSRQTRRHNDMSSMKS